MLEGTTYNADLSQNSLKYYRLYSSGGVIFNISGIDTNSYAVLYYKSKKKNSLRCVNEN